MQNLKVLDSFLFGFSNLKTFILSIMLPILSFCAEPNGEVAESIIQNNPRPQGERGPSKKMVEGQTKTFSHTPHPHKREPTPEEKSFLSLVNSTAKCNK